MDVFGIGTACAEHGVTMPVRDAAISNAKPGRTPGIANLAVIRSSGFLVNASSCQAFGDFIVVWAKGGIVFP